MKAAVVTILNPFDPARSSARVLTRPRRIRGLAPRLHAPFYAILNGRPVLRAGWRRRLRHGDILTFVVLPRGGGGGRGGSNPLATLASLALLAFAPWAAGALLGQAAGTVLFGSFTLGQAAQLGIILAGQALINGLIPATQPGGLPTPSPTYSLTAQGNTGRIDQPIPVQYGRVLSYPDFAAQPYTEFQGDEQYLFQLLCIGQGDHEVEDIRIEDTPLSSFEEVTTEVISPGGTLTLFPAAVVTSLEVSGQKLPGQMAGTWSRSGTVVTVTETAHGRASGQAVHLEFTTGGGPTGTYAIATVTGANTYTVTTATGSGSGNVLVRTVLGGAGGFTASAPATEANHLGVDLVLPRGLYATSGGNMVKANFTVTFEAQEIDETGAALGPWSTLGTATMKGRTTTPVRRSWRFTLPAPGRYRVRARREDVESTASDAGHEVLWAGLRAYLAEVRDFGDVTLLAMRMRATNNLSLQASRRVGVLATRKIQVWTGSAWSAPQASRSIAWALADAARNSTWGAGLPDARIDIAALAALDAVWADRGDRFDFRFDQPGSWWDAATRIAAAGRARLYMQAGRLRIVRDGPDPLPVAMFTMRTIQRGSFSVDYLTPTDDTADAVEVSYVDGATWTPQRVRCALPDSAAARPVKIVLDGVTSRAQAMREGMYHAAANRWRRRVVRFAVEMEGFVPSIGDLIAIQHDSPGWGAHAEAVSWDPVARRLTLSEPVIFEAGAHYVGLRRRDGSFSGPWEVHATGDETVVTFAEDPDITPDTGSGRERTHVVFGLAETVLVTAKVVSIRPAGLARAEIEAMVEDARVHTAEDGASAAQLAQAELPPRPVLPSVAQLFARKVPGTTDRAVFAWTPATGADLYQIEMAEGADVADVDATWTRIGDTTAAHYAAQLLVPARTMIRVRGVGLAAGPWIAATLGTLIPEMWNPSAATLMWTTDPALMWSA